MPIYEVVLKGGESKEVEATGPPQVHLVYGEHRCYQFRNGEPVVAEYELADVIGWSVKASQPDAVEVVVFIIVEIESRRMEHEEGTPMTEAQKEEYRQRPDVRQKAKAFVRDVATSAAGSATGSFISGLLALS